MKIKYISKVLILLGIIFIISGCNTENSIKESVNVEKNINETGQNNKMEKITEKPTIEPTEKPIIKIRIGLSAEYVNDTKYGEFSKVTGGYAGSWDHKRHYSYRYDWYDSAGNLIFQVKTFDGEVNYYYENGVEYKE